MTFGGRAALLLRREKGDGLEQIAAAWTREYVLASQEGLRPIFEDLASYYAACSPKERSEVEVEVREELERLRMTDEQRRTHAELWARLHATHRSD
jgi:hypothetical protein